jgi:elongation factor G
VFDGKRALSPSPNRLAPGDKVRRSAHLLRQQDGQAGRRFTPTVDTIIKRLGAKPLVIQLPIGFESSFEGVVDLVEMCALTWRGDPRVTSSSEPSTTSKRSRPTWSESERVSCRPPRVVAETDDALLERFMEGDTDYSVAEIKAAVIALTISSQIYPILCGSAFKNLTFSRCSMR